MTRIDWRPGLSFSELGAALEPMKRAHGLAAFPTASSYGLGAQAFDPLALERLLELKGERADKPLPLIAADRQAVWLLAACVPALAWRLAGRFWPGPLTLVLEARAQLPRPLTGGSGGVAVRVPGHPAARLLAACLGGVCTATSANRSGQPPASTPEQVAELLAGSCHLLLAAGPTPGLAPSTLIDLRTPTPRLLRVGRIDRAALEAALGEPLEGAS